MIGKTVLWGTLTTVAVTTALTGTASANDDQHGVLAGGLGSNLISQNADDSSSVCRGNAPVLDHHACTTGHARGKGGGDHRAVTGGVLSNVLSSNATDHSNVCNRLAPVLSSGSCTTNTGESHGHGPR
ncbi:hypothetical protein [Streptomyces sp. NPDC000134]|jgi:hypothetical protein|uniref:hypothetical protein n=1 Tax=Streptomyces sp. NPDC000134 TaxID=3364536 RepID=UPI0036BF20F2